ncbi:MAG: Na+/H+ antiporter subunit E [Fretibacterium sp.]|nr:Na+/H+ antiporter subunit E [Fretibacterium sp.]
MTVFVLSFLAYLTLAWSGESGGGILFEALGAASIVTLAAPGIPIDLRPGRGLSPRRWWLVLRCLFGPVLSGLVRGALEVGGRFTTGDMHPGIVSFDPHLKRDLARALLAGLLNLRPGILVLDIGGDGVFCLHLLDARGGAAEAEKMCMPLVRWVRRIAE